MSIIVHCTVHEAQPESLRGRTSSLEAVWDSMLKGPFAFPNCSVFALEKVSIKLLLLCFYTYIYIYVIYTNDICISCADLLCVRHHKVSTGILGRTRPSTKLKPSPLLGFCAVVQLAGANVSQHGVWSKQNWTYPLPVYPNGEMHTDRNKNARAAHGNRMGLY